MGSGSRRYQYKITKETNFLFLHVPFPYALCAITEDTGGVDVCSLCVGNYLFFDLEKKPLYFLATERGDNIYRKYHSLP